MNSEIYREDHPSLVIDVFNLAMLYIEQGNNKTTIN
ncbi:hypothetical protein [Neochlamydia sp. TUME1]